MDERKSTMVQELLRERADINAALADLGWAENAKPAKKKPGRPVGSRNRKKEEVAQS